MSNLFYDEGKCKNSVAQAPARKVMLATTSYDNPDASYTFSIARSREALHEAGILTAYLLLQGNCHVDDSRNTVVDEFLRSDCDELIFLDADVSWEPEHLVRLCSHDCDLVGGVYPYRREGEGESMPVRNISGVFDPDENGLLEVEGLPTGFMRIRRRVFDSMDVPTFKKEGRDIGVYFERDIWNGGRRGGDIRFCMNWRDCGGKLYADTTLYLGHAGKQVIRDSLGASLRRQRGITLKYVCDKIKEGVISDDVFAEALKSVNNPWGASRDVLGAAALLAREAKGDILEIGSGLSTVIMAAATKHTVWCVEHDPVFAKRVEDMAYVAGVSNIAVCTAKIKDGWYDMAEIDEMPRHFDVALLDGPPRKIGDRMKFFDHFTANKIVIDDAEGYAQNLEAVASNIGAEIHFSGKRLAIMKGRDDEKMLSEAG